MKVRKATQTGGCGIACRGFTLAETAFAILILGLGLLGVMAVFTGSAVQQQRTVDAAERFRADRNTGVLLGQRFGAIDYDGASGLDTDRLAAGAWFPVPADDDGYANIDLLDNVLDGSLVMRRRASDVVLYSNPPVKSTGGKWGMANDVFPPLSSDGSPTQPPALLDNNFGWDSGYFNDLDTARGVAPTAVKDRRDGNGAALIDYLRAGLALPHHNMVAEEGLWPVFDVEFAYADNTTLNSETSGFLKREFTVDQNNPFGISGALRLWNGGDSANTSFLDIDIGNDLLGPSASTAALVHVDIKLADLNLGPAYAAGATWVSKITAREYAYEVGRVASPRRRVARVANKRYEGSSDGAEPTAGQAMLVRRDENGRQQVATFSYGIALDDDPLRVIVENDEPSFTPPEAYHTEDPMTNSGNADYTEVLRHATLEVRYDPSRDLYYVSAETAAAGDPNDAWLLTQGQIFLPSYVEPLGGRSYTIEPEAVRITEIVRRPPLGNSTGDVEPFAYLDRVPVGPKARAYIRGGNNIALEVWAINPTVQDDRQGASGAEPAKWELTPLDVRVISIGS